MVNHPLKVGERLFSALRLVLFNPCPTPCHRLRRVIARLVDAMWRFSCERCLAVGDHSTAKIAVNVTIAHDVFHVRACKRIALPFDIE